jgi:DNA-binding response OmpR family regulator
MERILILPHNPALDEIMVSLVSVLEYEAVVATESDDPAWAIERVAPALVMLDADHPEAGEPALLVPAQHTNTPVLLFSASLWREELRRLADTLGVGHFLLPNGPRVLASAIADARTMAGLSSSDDGAMRLARWARLAAYHHGRNQEALARLAVDVEETVLNRKEAGHAREQIPRGLVAAQEVEEELHADVTRYVHHLKMLEVSKADTISRVTGVVHGALDGLQYDPEAPALEARVAQWCLEAYESATAAPGEEYAA